MSVLKMGAYDVYEEEMAAMDQWYKGIAGAVTKAKPHWIVIYSDMGDDDQSYVIVLQTSGFKHPRKGMRVGDDAYALTSVHHCLLIPGRLGLCIWEGEIEGVDDPDAPMRWVGRWRGLSDVELGLLGRGKSVKGGGLGAYSVRSTESLTYRCAGRLFGVYGVTAGRCGEAVR